jgi:mRNA interferase MazF
MRIKQFQVWIADLNPQMGTEPGKMRPVLIVQTDLLNSEHPYTLICPITTNVQPESVILRMHLRRGKAKVNDSRDIMIDQIRSIDNKRLLMKIDSIPNGIEEAVKKI